MRGSYLGRTPIRIAALLLIADGRPVCALELMDQGYYGRPMGRNALTTYIARLRRAGCRIGRELKGRRVLGYRLMEIPPDDMLPAVLPIVHRIKAGTPWRRDPHDTKRRKLP